MIHYKKFPFTELQGKLSCSQKPSSNSCHDKHIQSTHQSHFINTDICIIFKTPWSSTVSTVTRIYAGRYGVQILAGTWELSVLPNIHTSSSTHPASNSMKTKTFSLAVKWQCRQSDHSHPSRAKFKNQWSYTSTQRISLQGTHLENCILPLSPTFVHISQQVTSFLVLQSNPFTHHLLVTCTLHDTFILSPLIQLH